MRHSHEVANRVAALFELRPLRGYVRWKIRSDPAYPAVLAQLQHSAVPLVDVGCGVGILPFFLREHGWMGRVVGIDFDERKVGLAREAASRYREIDFLTADARAPLPSGHNVVLLDVLHYFSPSDQRSILQNASEAVPERGVIVIRQGLRDSSWRHRLTKSVDSLARTFRWMRGEPPYYPSRQEVLDPFPDFDVEASPLWGRMPYNNYLFVLRKR
ncbi:MAG TPA: class I SAM-dependent methyltransferase [Thermoanaerobaculia bacterium]